MATNVTIQVGYCEIDDLTGCDEIIALESATVSVQADKDDGFYWVGSATLNEYVALGQEGEHIKLTPGQVRVAEKWLTYETEENYQEEIRDAVNGEIEFAREYFG